MVFPEYLRRSRGAVERGEPEEKRLVFGTRLKHRYPLVAATAGVADHFLDDFPLLGRLPGWQLKTGHVGLAHLVEAILHRVAEVPLAGGGRPVAGGLEQFNERQPIRRQRPVQLFGIGLVRIGAGMMLARLGLHELMVRKALGNCIPPLARRSRCGVRTLGLPEQPRSSHARSSAIMNTMFGRVSAWPSEPRQNRRGRQKDKRCRITVRGVWTS